jgi:uncharacterized protein YdaU (DUF1376 family)
MNYYQHHIGDYRRDTAHLTLLEHGVYRQLLDMYYLAEDRIPEETESVYRRLCARTDEEKKAVDTILAEFFKRDNGWCHTRCEKEILAYQGKAERARNNGKLGGRPSRTKVVISGNLDETETKANHKPLTNNHKPRTNIKTTPQKPDDVDDQVWSDFLSLRKTKKAPVTKTALSGIRSQAAIAGYTMNQALAECSSRGWTGFKAEWVAAKPAAGTESAAERIRRKSLEREAAEGYTHEHDARGIGRE